ncbi:MAG: glycoside hydrolase family 3 N-terminal domain-containing protein [Actinomycetaceae bacterium]|nr:glycoside hydrolase family 3 N-terminal domain-containing protein [Actinomycetaceae bacterium]
MKQWNDTSLSGDERVKALMGEMSLEEKIAQLVSYWPKEEDEPAEDANGDVAPMEHEFAAGRGSYEAAAKEGLGHLTRVFGSAPVTADEGRAILADFQKYLQEQTRLGIPAIAHEECLTGLTSLGATVYPAAIAWGATFDPELVEEMASNIGADMKALGVHQGLSPLLDVIRDYRWGRCEETCGEDPYLVGKLGTAYVRGLQSEGIIATLKHFVGYSAARAGRNHAPVPLGRRELEDILLTPFEMAVREGEVKSVMNSYSDVDGQPAASSKELLTHILRERWGFDGVVVSDYWSVPFLASMHKVAGDNAEASALAVKAGLDVELPDGVAYVNLTEAVERGLITEEEIDVSVERLLKQKLELGLLDENPRVVGEEEGYDLDSARNREVARRMADESIILLKNNGILPLKGTGNVALVGPAVRQPRSFMGCYSFPNHVLSRFEEKGLGLPVTTLEDAIKEEFAGVSLTTLEGTGFTEGSDEDLETAVKVAKEADVAVVVVGDISGLFGGGTSGEGCDLVDTRLPGRQGELVERVLETGTPTVLVVMSGRPYALGDYASRCAAIVQAFEPGVEGGQAIAGVLSGRLNPEGRLPVGIPNNPGGQPGTYLVPALGWFSDGISNLDPRPIFPFGFGISYGDISYENVEVSDDQIDVDGSLQVEATVKNVGDRRTAETVQLYFTDPIAEVVRPLKQLIGFQKVRLEPGQSAKVTFKVSADRFSFTGADYKRIVEPGEIQLHVGNSSETYAKSISIQVTGNRREVGDRRVLTTPTQVEIF